MIELIKKYIDNGNMSNALLVGQNLFNKNKGDKNIFSLYFTLLLDAANTNYKTSDKYIEQLVTILSIYSENMDISEEGVNYIRECEERLNNLVYIINEKKKNDEKEKLKIIITNNDDLISSAKKLVSSLDKTKNKEEFDLILKDIYELDSRFDKNNFVIRQNKEYDEITNECQKIVDLKLKYFDRMKNIEYNKKAVASYEKIFKIFKNGNNKSYNNNDIIELFSYDASRLTNETLIYYNHVYNYILSKLNDDEKLTMTKLSIIAEKKE